MSTIRARRRQADEINKTEDRGSAAVHDRRGQLAEAKLAAYISELVASAPPISAEASSRLRMLLGGAK